MDGEEKTGVTSMFMSEGLDEGDIIFSEAIGISPEENAGSVHDRLMETGADLMSKTIAALADGTAKRIKQDESQSSYAAKILKEDTEICWDRSAGRIANLVRGLNPFPAAQTRLNGKILKIYAAQVSEGSASEPAGTVIRTGSGLTAVCGDGSLLEITELKEEGGKRMAAGDYLRGHPVAQGSIFSAGG
jgi:methionyl-tRNA formyltransferase